MKRIVIAVLSTISGLVLLFSYPTSTNRSVTADTVPATGTGTTTGAATTGSAAAGAAATTAPTAAAAAAPATAAKSGTFTGAAVQTRWGTVQVQIVVADGKVTSAEAIQYPNSNGRDQQINSYAIPVLNSEAVAASSAKIDMVSGATVTSGGYLKSLQDAIDQAFPA